MPQPEPQFCRSPGRDLRPAGRVAPGHRAGRSAHGAWLLCRRGLLGSERGRCRALPSHAAAVSGQEPWTLEPCRQPPLCRLCHSRSGPADSTSWEPPAPRCRSSSLAEATCCWSQTMPPGPPWAGSITRWLPVFCAKRALRSSLPAWAAPRASHSIQFRHRRGPAPAA